MKLRTASTVLAALTIICGASCSSSSSDNTNTVTGAVGGPVSGAQDDHCAGQPDGVSDPAACMITGSAGAGDDAAGGAPANDSDGPAAAGGATGTADCNLTHDPDYGDTMYNASGDDDDCKYHVSWTSTPIQKDVNVTFTVTATSKSTGAPLERIAPQPAGATALSEVEPYIPCDPTHIPPVADLNATIKETAPGVYTVGPIVFDKSDRWVVRFHFYEECLDSDTSPHGHAAFFVDVP